MFSLQISELMYNPSGSDNNHEWVEIYNNDTESVDLTIVKLRTDGTDHGLNNAPVLAAGTYAVIAQDNVSFLADYPDFAGIVIDSSWSDLSNSANKTIVLKNSTLVFDNITYEPLAAEGNALCRNISSFYECSPTPGAESTIVPPLAPPLSQAANTCDLSISLIAPEIYVSDYDIVVNSTDCTGNNVTIEYWIEDLFGSVAKDRYNTTQTISCSKVVERSWTSDVVEGSEAYIILARLAAATCADNNTGNDNTSKIIVAKGSPTSVSSSIAITGTDDSVKFGETATIELLIYRGDTGKYAVDVYVKSSDGTKVSSVSTFHANSKMKEYDVSIPVQLKPNCNGDFADGTYTVVAEGLDILSTINIPVAGVSSSNCKTVTVSSGGSSGGGSIVAAASKTSGEIVSYPETLYIGKEFETVVNITVSGKFDVYSYVYKGNTPVSEGYDGEKWSAAWTANRREVSSPELVALKSRIEDGTLPGIYNLRVKIKGTKEEDITKEIEVKEKSRLAAVSLDNPSNVTAKNVTNITKPLSMTGFATAKQHTVDREMVYRILSLVVPRLFKK